MKSVEQYVKEGKIGFFTEEDTTEKTEPITIPVTKIRLNIILMKLQMELFTDLYGVFAVLTNGRIHQKNRSCFI